MQKFFLKTWILSKSCSKIAQQIIENTYQKWRVKHQFSYLNMKGKQISGLNQKESRRISESTLQKRKLLKSKQPLEQKL